MKHSMMKAILYAIILLFLFLLLGLFFSQGSSTDSASSVLSDMDALERQREMTRHKKLQAMKNHPKNVLTEFTTDGCSGGVSVGWEYFAATIPNFQKTHGSSPAWESCCTTHDRTYHSGGSQSMTATMSFEARRKADLVLKACILETGRKRSPELIHIYNISAAELDHIYKGIANLTYSAVRIGGMPCTDLPWRWGYGWPECR